MARNDWQEGKKWKSVQCGKQLISLQMQVGHWNLNIINYHCKKYWKMYHLKISIVDFEDDESKDFCLKCFCFLFEWFSLREGNHDELGNIEL